MARNYYYLVSGLREYDIDADTKGFDAVAIRNEISEELHPTDREYLRDFYTFFDITNIISLWNGKSAFNKLGNFTKEELAEELEIPVNLPDYIAGVVIAYKNKIKEDKRLEVDETIDTDLPFERTLWSRFYDRCDSSGNEFIRKWYAFDRELRNVGAAFAARSMGRDVETELIGSGDYVSALGRSTAADFGLKGEIDYVDTLLQILDTPNMVEKERRLDMLRWNKADEFTDFDYFNMNKILAYCVKIDIIYRWMSLDRSIGREMFDRLVAELTGKELVERAVNEAENAAGDGRN